MPRQDVPYGGAICRLRERIAEIFDKLEEKLHTINGVPGDGDGNVKIISGSSAVVISNDPTQNEIAVSLDTSQLPAAAVSSVNGQTGAVVLDAGDITTIGGSGDVQADLQDLASDINSNTAAINAEVLARQGADATLQTNINAALATIPGEVTSQIANNAQIIQLQSDVVNLDNDIDTLGNSVILTTGNQNASGIKRMNNIIPGVLGLNIRISATDHILVGSFDFYNSTTYYIPAIIAGRATLGLAIIRIDTDSSDITALTLGRSFFLDNQLTPAGELVAYVEDNRIILGVGNRTSGNYIYSVVPVGCFYGAARAIVVDVSNSGNVLTLPATYHQVNI